MKSFKVYILEIKTNNKTLFEAEKIQLSPASLEKQLERAFVAGFKYCEDLKNQIPPEKETDFSSIFRELFEKK